MIEKLRPKAILSDIPLGMGCGLLFGLTVWVAGHKIGETNANIEISCIGIVGGSFAAILTGLVTARKADRDPALNVLVEGFIQSIVDLRSLLSPHPYATRWKMTPMLFCSFLACFLAA